MEFPDELLSPNMIKALAGKEPVLIAIVARDEEGQFDPHVAVAEVPDGDRPLLSAAVQQLAYVVGYPDLEVEEFFALSLVALREPAYGHHVMGMTAGAPFGPPIAFMRSFASILAGIGAKLGVDTAISDTSGTDIQAATLARTNGCVHGAPSGPDEPPTGQYL